MLSNKRNPCLVATQQKKKDVYSGNTLSYPKDATCYLKTLHSFTNLYTLLKKNCLKQSFSSENKNTGTWITVLSQAVSRRLASYRAPNQVPYNYWSISDMQPRLESTTFAFWNPNTLTIHTSRRHGGEHGSFCISEDVMKFACPWHNIHRGKHHWRPFIRHDVFYHVVSNALRTSFVKSQV